MIIVESLKMFFKVGFSFTLAISILFVLVRTEGLEYELITDYTVNDCLRVENDQKQKYFTVDSDGFPYCETYNVPKTCDENNECNPGLKCDNNQKKCVVDTASCFKYYANIKNNENILKLLWTPDCLEEGLWAPKQCKGGTAGRCFCYGAKGQRLFGSSFRDDSSNMTCACSRRKSELLDTANPNKRSYVSFHCDDQGNYEELQCDTNHCWCADSKSGDLTSMIVPEKAMKYLPCGSKLKGDQYLRRCESQAYAQSKIMEVMMKHGTTSPNIQVVACGNDGSYGPYTIENSQVYCVTKSNSKTTYQSSISEIQTMNCNCALDQELYKRLGRVLTLTCDSNGNYKPLQSILESNIVKNFCVDSDGNKKVDDVGKTATDAYCNKFYD